MFSDILLTVDFDRTLTALDGSIPESNLRAIEYFIRNGGAFTVNTGRSYVSFRPYLSVVPVNAPLLLLNGSAAWAEGEICDVHNITLDVWPTLERLRSAYPDVQIELQAADMHYLIAPSEAYAEYYRHRDRPHQILPMQRRALDFVKIGVYADARSGNAVDREQEKARFDRIEDFMRAEFSGRLEVYRSTPNIINIHAAGVSKGNAARTLQKKLGRKVLVCVGDEGNDISMLRAADHAFCPGDAMIAGQFCNVCPCAQGAVAEVIMEKLPQILKERRTQ